MKSKKEILNSFKVCHFSDECSGCSYLENGICSGSVSEDIIEYIESNIDYKSGMEEAWDIMKTAWDMDCEDFFECFGYDDVGSILKHFTANEAAQKIKDWQNRKVSVGDVVIADGVNGVVVDTDGNTLYVLNENRILEPYVLNDIIKTDKHINLDSLFKQIEQGGN
jgi:hypothetical protein